MSAHSWSAAFSTDGASDIGFATSTNAGVQWISGPLPGTTIYEQRTFSAASAPVVTFDAAHATWIISYLAIANADQVAVSRFADGFVFDHPIVVSTTPDSDKNWITCDNTPASRYFGQCYVEWDDPGQRPAIVGMPLRQFLRSPTISSPAACAHPRYPAPQWTRP